MTIGTIEAIMDAIILIVALGFGVLSLFSVVAIICAVMLSGRKARESGHE